MKRSDRLLAVVALIIACVTVPTASGQDSQDQLGKLRRHLGVSDDTVIRTSLINPTVPNTRPLKVALAFGLDVKVTQNFVKWVQEDWNDWEAKKRGRIELVDDINEAEVVLVRYLDRTTEAGKTASGVALPLGPGALASAQSEPLVPVTAYILKRTAAGFDVIGGYEGTTSTAGTSSTGRQMWDDMKKLMKKRPK
jgi:hypothetical protein